MIIGTVWPEPNSSAAGSRMMQLIDLFQKQNWDVTFASSASDSEFMADLSVLGIERVSIELNDSSFDAFIKRLNPDIAVFDRFMTEEQYGWRIAENCPDTMRILDTEDLHCLRYARQNAFKEKREFHIEDLMNDYAKREIASVLRCDLSLVISGYEMELLESFFKIDKKLLLHLPFMVKPLNEAVISKWPSFNQRQHFVTIGNFLHEPNWNSVLYLKEEIWPFIRKALPEAELHVYGAYPSQKVFNLHNPKEGFLIKGRADNVEDVMKTAKVCLAPLRFGAGLKGKLLDAMTNGTPSVTTSIGAEAMHEDLKWPGTIVDSAKLFAEEAVKLYSEESLWLDAQKNIAPIISTIYNLNLLGVALIDKIENIKSQLNQHRMYNFVGSLLMHHSMQSTKYMSRWIEAKNQLGKS